MATKPGSTAQKPEKLFREPGLIAIVAALVATFIFTTFVDIPLLVTLTTASIFSAGWTVRATIRAIRVV
ncbi:hypothetical protein ACC862_38260, partial [Rhizobium ruizarguesonis]